MKKILLLFILLIGIQNLVLSQSREETLQRYSNGEKSLVVTYVGQGNNEKIIKRTYYFENGTKKKEENLKDGKLHGVREEYNRDGNILRKDMYTNGELTKRLRYCTYYENGQLKEDVFPVYKMYYESGQLKRDGDKEYYESGQLKKEGDKEYYENGRLKRDGDVVFLRPVKEYIDEEIVKEFNQDTCDSIYRYNDKNRYESAYKRYLTNGGYSETDVKDGLEYIFNVKIPEYCNK